MYAKPISFLVGSTNMYEGIFDQMCLLPQIIIPFLKILLVWNYDDVVVGCWITSKYPSEYEKLCCDCLNEFLPE